MVFAFRDDPSPRRPTAKRPSQDAFHLAVCHREWVRKQGWALSRDKTVWAAAVQPLLSQVGTPRCEDALLWYHKQLTRPKPAFGLKLFTMKDFAKFFNLIEAAKEKDVPVLKDHPLLDRVLVPITRHPWPDQTKDLKASVNTTLHTIDTVSQTLRQIDTRSPLVKRAATRLAAEIGPLAAFADRWYAEVYEQVKDWDKWGGSLKPHTVGSNRADCFAGWMEDVLVKQMGQKQADMAMDDLQLALDKGFLV